MKRVAVCLHDLRLSEALRIKETVEGLRRRLGTRFITCHLIMDAEFKALDETALYLKNEIDEGRMEVVFHGITHRCASGTGRWLSWYHKGEAEFLGSGFDEALNQRRYAQLKEGLRTGVGICPPCWLAGKSGRAFLENLSPLFLEGMLTIRYGDKAVFSPVISLGSRSCVDLFFLKILAAAVTAAAGLLRCDRIRLVVHAIDMESADSVDFFRKQFARLQSGGYLPTLQRELT